MWEMILKSWEGWNAMHTSGKYIALLLLLLIYLWCRKGGYRIGGKAVGGGLQAEQTSERTGWFLSYTTLLTIACVLPVTGALLMVYQTKFYDYPWIWSLVPITPMLAYGLVQVLEDGLQAVSLKKNWKRVLFVLSLLAVLCLAGGLGSMEQELQQEKTEYETAELLLDDLAEEGEGLCLWAPKSVLQYVRMIDSRVQVAYGRDMWDKSLNAFFYDVYGEAELELYETMCQAEEKSRFTDYEILSLATEQGITHLVLPAHVLYSDVVAVAECLGSEIQEKQGYFVIPIQ